MSDDAKAAPASWLVADPGARPVLTDNRETDTRTALLRGLAEYIEIVSADRGLGLKVTQGWADPEEQASYPNAQVTTYGKGSYDAKSLTPQTRLPEDRRIEPGPTGTYISDAAEFTQTLQVIVYATDQNQRVNLIAELEQAFSPVLHMYGFKLALPHYHGQFAVYEMLDVEYQDDDTAALTRIRKAVFTLTGQLALSRMVRLPQVREVRPIVTVDA